MVPVLDNDNQPLMPCSEKRARKLMESGQAKAWYQKSVFCIKLLKEPSARSMQPIALGIDTGSKREGYTVLTPKTVVLNITSNTPDWVKKQVEKRHTLRKARRQRKTPYRKMRANRATLHKPNRIPPSTKARWQAKLRLISILQRILPITHINVEDIAAVSKEGKVKWNLAFSPLEVGKNWFYGEVRKLGIQLSTTEGTDTKKHRDSRGFKKLTGKQKMLYTWESHNCDSHSLAEMALKTQIQPFFGLYQVEFRKFDRRKLHQEQPHKGGIRTRKGGTVSLGWTRGSTVQYRASLWRLSGSSAPHTVDIYNIETGKRQNFAKKEQVRMVHTGKHITRFIRSASSSTSRTNP